MIDLQQVKYDSRGLIPAVIQDCKTKQVLMLAYMNRDSLAKTIDTGHTWFWSRSRQELWEKGATSGHYQQVRSINLDCDGDAVLVQVEQRGPACHTGEQTCFHNPLWGMGEKEAPIIEELFNLIKERKASPKEGSYTSYLFDKGIDKICKKIGEEAAEVIIGAKNGSKEELVYELGDLCYHALVLMAAQGIEPCDIEAELKKRRK